MGTKAEGAAQGYTVLGAIVLIILGLNMTIQGLNAAAGSDFNGVVTAVLGIVLIVMAVLSLDACGFIYWKIRRNGLLLAIFGFISIVIVIRGLSFDIIGWLMNVGTLAGLMIMIAGILIMTKG
ncbi:MAG: hypothetical protein HXY34_03120 [Candidatus Thorarchaeota archaeon]|nr:hypothetical protein [Candidatus Thorarchaeota archaeon]